MADNLIFPIGFDLEKAVAQAGKDWDGKFADKLEKLIAKRPVNVSLKLDTKSLDNLDAVKKRLAGLKVEPITPETKTAIKELASELKTLAKALEQVQKYSVARASTSPDAVRASKIHINEEKAKAQAALAAQRASKAEDNLAAARLKDARAANVGASATRNANNEYSRQSTYLKRLIGRLAAYYSIHQIGNFLTSVREVTAQFELQRVSLGAIIQDQTRANALFSEIKSFALKSPVSIMDLTKYTKQLAAYKIGVDELFETTKKLTDVSVGLGVSMDRVVLAYGQTRATGYLRASEIRQFTEMGVPIIEELAAKLTKMNGELVTAAQVMDMVSKRAISFELVKEVFDDMTSAGGMFYNMQEKQGNTLFGLWAKLGDAASVMYDEIGNTESVNKGMKKAIQMLTDLMKNWRAVATELKLIGIGFAVFKTATVIIKAMQVNAIATAAATRSMTRASIQHRAAVAAGNIVMGAYTNMLRRVAVWNRKAALSTNLFTVAANKLKVALVSWGPMAIVAGLSLLITHLVSAAEKAGRLRKELDGIAGETGVEISRMVTNFESLAKKAVEAADGSKEQRDALSELQRTYRNIIPEQNLTIEKLREMKGEYSNLTIAIRDYIREQQLQKGLNTITEEYGSRIIKAQRELRDKLQFTAFKSEGGANFYLDGTQVDRILGAFQSLVTEGKSVQDALREAFELEDIDHLVKNYTLLAEKLGLIKTVHESTYGSFGEVISQTTKTSAWGLASALNEQQLAIENFKKQLDATVPGLGNFTEFLDEAKKTIEETPIKSKPFTFDYDIEKTKVQIEAYTNALQDALDFSGVKIDLSKYITLDPKGIKHIDFTGFSKELDGVDSEFKTRLQRLSTSIQDIYDGLIPSDRTVASLINKLEQLSNKTGASMDKMRRYLMKSGESWADYSKRIEDEIKSYEDSIAQMKKSNKAVESGENAVLEFYSEEEIAKANTEMKTLIALLDYLKKSESKGGGGSDPRLGILQEMVSTLKQVNKEYEDLAKKEGDVKSLADTKKTYADTFKNMQALAEKYKFDLPGFGVPTDTASLTKYLESIKSAMAKLPKSQKAVLSLQVDIDKLNIDDKQKQIEEELKRLADRVSHTKTAQEFFNKILGDTGDIDIATSVTMSIYGDTGNGLFDAMVAQLQETFGQDIDLSMAIDMTNMRIDYGELQKIFDIYKEQIPEARREGLQKMIADGQKSAGDEIANLYKVYEKAKSFEEQRTEVMKRESENRSKIIKSNIPEEEKQSLIKSSQKREKRELVKIDVEEFKASDDYIKAFQELGKVSNSTLDRLEAKLRGMIAANKDIDATNIKAYADALDKINAEREDRNAFKAITDGMREYTEAVKARAEAEEALRKAQAEYEVNAPMYAMEVGQAQEEKRIADTNVVEKEQTLFEIRQGMAALQAQEIVDEQSLAEYKNLEIQAENELVAAQLSQNSAAVKLANAMDKRDKASNNIADAEKKRADAEDKRLSALNKQQQGYSKLSSVFSNMASVVDDLRGLFGEFTEDGTEAGEVFGAISDTLGTMGKAFGVVAAGITAAIVLTEVWNTVLKTNPLLLILSAIALVTAAVASGIKAANNVKAKRLEKEIERIQKQIEGLEYTYKRLQKAAEDAFGSDYIQNFNQQMEVLKAQAEGYKKQAEKEKAKGKKADEKKVEEFENSYQETMDEIEDRADELVEHFAGSDLTSAARDWARAWIDAKTSFSNTTDAMKEKFADMMKNMIVESMAAAIMKQALKPFYDGLEKAMEDEVLDSHDIIDLANIGLSGIDDANAAMEKFWNTLKAKGLDIKEIFGDGADDLTGISREIATASEESINGLAAGINTQNFYMSHVPHIAENVQAMRMLMESGGMPSSGGMTMTDLVTMQNQHLSQLPVIAANTAEMVVRCERAAAACENISLQLGRVIRPKGSPASHSVSTTLN